MKTAARAHAKQTEKPSENRHPLYRAPIIFVRLFPIALCERGDRPNLSRARAEIYWFSNWFDKPQVHITRCSCLLVKAVRRACARCRLITYWPARSIYISGAGPEFRRNSRRASPVKCARGSKFGQDAYVTSRKGARK